MENKIVQEKFEKMKSAMAFIGFSKEEAEKQINELGEIILMETMKKIIEDNPNENLNNENINDFIKNKYSEEEMIKISAEKSVLTIKNYLDEITSGLDENKKKYFYKFLE